MSKSVDAGNVGNVCRLCLSTKEPKSSVFDDQALASVSLATKIHTFLSIEILISDKISTRICSDCLKRINKWQAYKEQCLCSQQKLKQRLGERTTDGVPNIKIEPTDHYEPTNFLETVLPPGSDEEDGDRSTNQTDGGGGGNDVVRLDGYEEAVASPIASIKKEMTDGDSEEESVHGAKLLLNPMAVVGGNREERSLAADATAPRPKLTKNDDAKTSPRQAARKKPRRTAPTHYRGSRRYKQRCAYCQIYLHSKYSYAQHMKRFHSGGASESTRVEEKKNGVTPRDLTLDEDEIDETDGNGITADEGLTESDDTEMFEATVDGSTRIKKDVPLTPVQKNIISQLKTFSCYNCRLCFADRRGTLNHIRRHMPDLRPYTCIACLTEFADRTVYKLHCGASFQCAMKIALVVPEHGTEKYFTCNMCLRSLPNRRELLNHLSKHSDRPYDRLTTESPVAVLSASLTASSSMSALPKNSEPRRGKLPPVHRTIPAPYKNGDPAHNHPCVHCGMIYRYKQNMFKHVSLCKKLPAENRVCYRCVHCGMTFLAFNKFRNHTNDDHRKKELACCRCNIKLKGSNEFLEHYQGHYASAFPSNAAVAPTSIEKAYRPVVSPKVPRRMNDYVAEQPWNMEERDTKQSILEARTADRERNFPSPSEAPHELEAYLRTSIKSDPSDETIECRACGKVFANYPNLRRHMRIAHGEVGPFNCFTCAKTFEREEDWMEHVECEHRRYAEQVESCPECPGVFESRQELIQHCGSVHGTSIEDRLACYICGKSFTNKTSLKIHRGHHFRVNSRLSIGNAREMERANDGSPAVMQLDEHEEDRKMSIASMQLHQQQLQQHQHQQQQQQQQHKREQPSTILKSPRARKSFPNGSPASSGWPRGDKLQCQVCDDRFDDVTNLRKHLWDVHCAREKTERSPSLMSESLASHAMNWPGSDRIRVVPVEKREMQVQCDLCGKYYSSIGNLRKHKKRHRASEGWLGINGGGGDGGVPSNLGRKKWSTGEGVACDLCRKAFGDRSTMLRHRAAAHPTAPRLSLPVSKTTPAARRAIVDKAREIKTSRPNDARFDHRSPPLAGNDSKKLVVCNLCRKIMPDEKTLYKHRRFVHKIMNDNAGLDFDHSDSGARVNRVPCTVCTKLFNNLANMRQHFTKMHAGYSGTPASRNVSGIPPAAATAAASANIAISGNVVSASVNPSNRYLQSNRCPVRGCERSFETLAGMRSHEKTHANVLYTCALCPHHTLNPAAMAVHMMATHKTNAGSDYDKLSLCKKIDLDIYVVEGANGRQCPVCKIIYPNNKALKVHYLKMHEA